MSKNNSIKYIYFMGPRIQDLGGFQENDLQKSIKKEISDILKELKQSDQKIRLITSLTLGIETWAAESAFSLKIPYSVVIPFKDPHAKWPLSSRQHYTKLLKYSIEKVVLDNGKFSREKLILKDNAILDKADTIYSFFPDDSWLLSMAQKKNKYIIHSLPSGEKDGYFIKL